MGSKMKGMAAEAATASGRGPLSMSLYWPSRVTTPTAKSCMWGCVHWLSAPAHSSKRLGAAILNLLSQAEADHGKRCISLCVPSAHELDILPLVAPDWQKFAPLLGCSKHG